MVLLVLLVISCVCVCCVCVWTIWKDVKFLNIPYNAGDGEDVWGSTQRSSSCDPRVSPGAPGGVPATPFYFPVNGPAKPRTGIRTFLWTPMSTGSLYWTLFAIWTTADFVSWNSCFCKAKKRKSSLLVFLPCHPTLTYQNVRDSLCTTDAKIFWASVSFLLYTSSWQEPFGESLSRLTIDIKSMSEFTILN